MRYLLQYCCIIISLLGCGSDDQSVPSENDNNVNIDDSLEGTDFNILFVGNSLTSSNGLPQLVVEEAKLKHDLVIGTGIVLKGNYAIHDHWNEGEAQKQINSGKYDFVVIQQGPSSQAFGRQILIESGGDYKALCEANGADLVYYMVWPSRQYYHTFDGVIKNHEDAAMMNNALLAPVGAVWKAHFDRTEDFSYYDVDEFHPSLKGSQVAAEVIVETLF